MPLINYSPLGLTTNSSSEPIESDLKQYVGATKTQTYGNTSWVTKNSQETFFGGVNISGKFNADKSGSKNIRAISHDDGVYGEDLASVIAHLAKTPSTKVKYSDFAYLSNLGVYPHNRLMIARRFRAPVKDNLREVVDSPMATLIGWFGENKPWCSSFTFGEEWTSADANFVDILNSFGKDVTPGDSDNSGKSGWGDMAAGGFNVIPLPGLTESLQYKVMENLGLAAPGTAQKLPSGNPNLIREAKIRKTIAKGEAGSGLKASIVIPMEVEYEQKYIYGVDPTLAYLDILSNILNFGTSEADFQLTSKFATGTENILSKLGSGSIKQLNSLMTEVIEALKKALLDIVANVSELVKSIPKKVEDIAKDPKLLESAVTSALTSAAKLLGATLGKYRIKLLGVIYALTGAASTPWHITVGNPKRPIFSSGDMIIDDVELELSDTLGMNDLPMKIKAKFTLKNARNLGADEIFRKLNAGSDRTYTRVRKSSEEAGWDVAESELKTAADTDKMLKDTPPLIKAPTQNTAVPPTTNALTRATGVNLNF